MTYYGDGSNLTGVLTAQPIAWQAVQTSAFTAVAGRGYPVNTTSAAIVCTLPASASVGDIIEFVDYAGTWDTNRVELDPQSLNLKGDSDSLFLTYDRQGVRIVYVDATQGWVAVTGVNEDNPAISTFAATGGTITNYSSGGNDYRVHTFTTSGQFTVTGIPGSVDAMVVGAGGGGRNSMSGGGGGGGMITMSGYTASLGNHTVVVGAGSTGGDPPSPVAGNSTTFGGETATGGGGGGRWGGSGSQHGLPGANGGGGGDNPSSQGGTGTAPSVADATISTGFGGFNGGAGGPSNGGAGAGCGAVGGGANPGGQEGGNGGAGKQYNLDNNNYYWGGGAGGGSYYGQAGDGGQGGGGAATWWQSTCAGGATGSAGVVGGSAINPGTQATACGTGGHGGANSGGGGGASVGNGGSGCVQIRYIL